MNCPICMIPLNIAERQGIEIDYCPKCRGVWLDRGELDKIIERSMSETSSRAQSERPERPADSYDQRYDNHHGHYDKHHDKHHGEHHRKRSFLHDLFD